MRGKAFVNVLVDALRGITPAYAGKSPHPRVCFCAVQGITPAYAGKSGLRTKCSRQSRDHPRICGEKVGIETAAGLAWGSPPHMRGKGCPLGCIEYQHRITPAYAGKSLLLTVLPLLRWDHPRICGEKPMITKPFPHIWGSPPHMRGKGQQPTIHLQLLRITPAYAGKRLCRQLAHCLAWDHPRICGEKTKKIP